MGLERLERRAENHMEWLGRVRWSPKWSARVRPAGPQAAPALQVASKCDLAHIAEVTVGTDNVRRVNDPRGSDLVENGGDKMTLIEERTFGGRSVAEREEPPQEAEHAETAFRTIVVGTDGSETAQRAVEVAAKLAQKEGSDLHVVMVHKSTPVRSPGSFGLVTPPIPDLRVALLQDHAKTVVETATTELARRGLKTHAHAVAGNPADALLAVARDVDADLIVVGSKGMRGARRVLGSVPNSVAHEAPCAVLVARTA
jgi:nucleotide-binding universal stress UspA family protein